MEKFHEDVHYRRYIATARFFHIPDASVNRCEQVYGDTKCQCFISGGGQPPCTRERNCRVVQTAHQSALLPGTYISSNMCVGIMPSEQMVKTGSSQATMYSRCAQVKIKVWKV